MAIKNILNQRVNVFNIAIHLDVFMEKINKHVSRTDNQSVL